MSDGITVKPVFHRTDIDYVAMPVKSGSYDFVHGSAESIFYKLGFFAVEHDQTFLCAYQQLLRRDFCDAVDLLPFAFFFIEKVLELVFFFIIIR